MASRGSRLCCYFNFYSLQNIWKDQPYRISRSEFYEWLYGPEKCSGLSRSGPQVFRQIHAVNLRRTSAFRTNSLLTDNLWFTTSFCHILLYPTTLPLLFNSSSMASTTSSKLVKRRRPRFFFDKTRLSCRKLKLSSWLKKRQSMISSHRALK